MLSRATTLARARRPRPLGTLRFRPLGTLRFRMRQDGAVWPFSALSADEARTLRAQLELEMSGLKGGDFKTSDFMYYMSHLVFGAVDALARHPPIVKAVQELLDTPDILLWDSSIPLKLPATQADGGGFFPWHQDATNWGLAPPDGAVSCWVALSEASDNHGCMRVIRGSHAEGQLQHVNLAEAGSMLRRGQRVEGVDEAAAEPMALDRKSVV